MTIIPITKEQKEELIKEEIDKADNKTKRETEESITFTKTDKEIRDSDITYYSSGITGNQIPKNPPRLTIFHWFKHIIYADYWQRKRKKRRERTLLHMQFETKQDIVREQDKHKENIARMENKLLNIQGKLLQYESETKR